MRILGWTFLALAILALAAAVLAVGPSVAEAWAMLDANSLVGFQGVVDARFDPDPGNPTVWFDYVLPALEARILYVAAAVLGVAGLALAPWKRPAVSGGSES